MYLERLRAQHGVAVLAGDMSDAGMATPPAPRYVAERPPAQPTMLDVPIWVWGSMIGVLCNAHIGRLRK